MLRRLFDPSKVDFEIAVHDVRQGQWEAVMGENPSYFSRFGVDRKAVQDIPDEELKLFPVECVSWDDAQEFIKKLNEKRLGITGDPEIATRISSFEMAYRMQSSAPELMDLSKESAKTLAMYGAEPGKPSFANNCLLARRLV